MKNATRRGGLQFCSKALPKRFIVLVMQTTSATVVIPARLASTRLPRKVLLDLGGKPVIQHVWEKVSQMKRARAVVIATDSDEVVAAAKAFGADVRLTSPQCRNGTERLVELMQGGLEGDFFLNVQGDEPFIAPVLLDSLVLRREQTACDLVTAVYAIKEAKQLQDPNLVKVARAQDGHAIYFSRSPIPYLRGEPIESWCQKRPYWGHLGVYGYSRKALEIYPTLEIGGVESAESLEQLRFLEKNMSFQTVETDYHAVAIDTPEDLEHARALLNK